MHITYPPGGGAQHKPLATISNPFGVKNYISIPERYHFVRLIAIHLLHLFFKDHQGRAMINRPYGTEEVAFNSQRPLPGFLEWQIGHPFGGWCENQMEEINGVGVVCSLIYVGQF